MTVRFVLLGYTRDISAERGIDIALAVTVAHDSSTESAPLTLHTAPNWASFVAHEDRQYLEAVFADLLALPANESWQMISQLSVGCLRTNREGVCDDKNLPKLGVDPLALGA